MEGHTLNPNPNITVVLEALNSLYKGSDLKAKEKASKYLSDMQKSVEGWQVADQLLHLQHDDEATYFAAQTMRSKIQFSFQELPSENYQSLYGSLMSHCKKISKHTKKYIVTQLALCLADFALKIGTWKNSIADLLKEFSADEKDWDFLLEVLQLFPEEVNSHPLKLGENRRNEIYAELRENSEVFVDIILKIMKGDAAKVGSGLKCVGSWMGVYAVKEKALLDSSLIDYALNVLFSSDLFTDEAADFICAAFLNIQDEEENKHLKESLLKQLHLLYTAYDSFITAANTDKSKNFCKIFTNVGESLMKFITKKPTPENLLIVDKLISCLDHHSYEMADVTLTFWLSLSENLYDCSDAPTTHLFRPYIIRFMVSLCRLCKYDDDNTDIQSDDKDFEEFRKGALDVAKEVLFVPGPELAFNNLRSLLEATSATTPPAPWSSFEAILFILKVPSKKIQHDSASIAPVLQYLVAMLPSTNHVSLYHTTLTLIGCLNSWFKNNLNFTELILPFVFECLSKPKLGQSSADCLQKLCTSCPQQMVTHLSDLINFLERPETIQILTKSGVIRLLEAVSSTLSCLEASDTIEGLKHLATPSLNSLTICGEEAADKNEDEVLFCLDRLASLFKYVHIKVSSNQTNPCFQVLEHAWPVLSRIINKYADNAKVIEHTCRCLRNGIRNFGKNNPTLILPILTQMVEVYKTYPHSCCVYMGSILVDSYSRDPANVAVFLTALNEFSVKTFSMIGELEGMVNFPDIVDDFFRLANRFLQHCPLAFLGFGGCETILNSAVLCLSISHTGANYTVVHFITSFIALATGEKENIEMVCNSSSSASSVGSVSSHESLVISAEVLKQQREMVIGLLGTHGRGLVDHVIRACLFDVPFELIGNIASIITKLLKIDEHVTIDWLKESLNSLPSQSSAGTLAVTEDQKNKFMANVICTRDENELAECFGEFSYLFK